MQLYQTYADLRDSRGLSDYRVAKDTGISFATFTRWKKGEYTPRVETLEKIARYMGIEFHI